MLVKFWVEVYHKVELNPTTPVLGGTPNLQLSLFHTWHMTANIPFATCNIYSLQLWFHIFIIDNIPPLCWTFTDSHAYQRAACCFAIEETHQTHICGVFIIVQLSHSRDHMILKLFTSPLTMKYPSNTIHILFPSWHWWRSFPQCHQRWLL